MSDDWRETLFVWDGILSPKKGGEDETGDDDDCVLVWKGTWVGTDSADARDVPTPVRGAFDAYVESDNKFCVEGRKTAAGNGRKAGEENEEDNKTGGGGGGLRVYSLTGGTGYDLGEGPEKKRHVDDRHDVYMTTHRWGGCAKSVENLVVALGENEFGSFVSTGWLRVGNRLTLARRYLAEGDERTKWDADDLRGAVLGEISGQTQDGKADIAVPPWQCAAMHASPGQARKKQKKQASEES